MSEPGEYQSGASATEQVGQKAQQLAEQAQEKAGDLAAQAQPKIGEAQQRVRATVDQRSSETGEQLRSVAEVMRHTSSELRSRGNDPHAKIAEQAADRIDRLGGYLTNADADQMLADVEDLARRQPLVVAAGGLIVGLAAARFLKASSERRSGQHASNGFASREIAARPAAVLPAGPSSPAGY
jgi:hypothetical protein